MVTISYFLGICRKKLGKIREISSRIIDFKPGTTQIRSVMTTTFGHRMKVSANKVAIVRDAEVTTGENCAIKNSTVFTLHLILL
jgi:hypothetical protein